MLKIARPVSFLLLSAALCSSGTVFAANETATPKVGISQQQKSLKGTVNDVAGPRSRCFSCRKRYDERYGY